MTRKYSLIVLIILFFNACGPDEPIPEVTPYEIVYPAILDQLLPPISMPIDNPLTVEGVELGKKLFFDPQLSADESLSCASCHAQNSSFTDPERFSVGIDGIAGSRNSMPLVNLGWMFTYFWDGRSLSIESQAFRPVTDPIEMHETWPNVESKLSSDPEYRSMFRDAFGTSKIDSNLVVKAIAQYERTLISGNSPFDRHLLGESTGWSVDDFNMALEGLDVFMSETKGDCFHCHGGPSNPLWTDNFFHNNGLDETFSDIGFGNVTGNPGDNGKFKTPTLRNLLFTAPYMHDGRFNSLEEVIDHYSEGLKNSTTIDPLMKNVAGGGVQLSAEDKANLLMFLKSLTDSSFLEIPSK